MAAIDHVRQSVQRLLWQFQDRPVFRSLVQAVGKELNELETAFAGLRDLTIETEEGAALDGDGALVGIPRAGRDDTDYRAAIRAQIIVNSGQARIEDILFALESAWPGGVYVLSEPDPASIVVEVTTPMLGDAPSAATLAALLDVVSGGGIRHTLIYQTTPVGASAFTFAVGDTADSDPDLGWADDAQSAGGYWADAIA